MASHNSHTEQALLGRTEFMVSLIHQRRRPESKETNSSDDYHRGLLSSSKHGDIVAEDAPVLLHGHHRISKDVARQWLLERNTCPRCNIILFEEEVGHDDNINLRRIWNLQMLQNSYADRGDLVMRRKVYDMWRKLARTRAKAFDEGHIIILPQDFGIYNERSNFSIRTACKKNRRLDASVLIPQLNRLWDTTFAWASLAATSNRSTTVRGVNEDRPTLKAPCHPLAIALLDDMVDCIQERDGMIGRVEELRFELHQDFVRSGLYKMWRELVSRKKAPQGFYVFQGHVVDMMLSAFLQLPECTDKVRRTHTS